MDNEVDRDGQVDRRENTGSNDAALTKDTRKKDIPTMVTNAQTDCQPERERPMLVHVLVSS